MASPIPDDHRPVSEEIQMERNAGLIMATNNSSIVSKRSVERLYLPEPHFFKYFVKKSVRRSPTINRGYWLRMRAVEWAVRQFLEKPTDQQKLVINLGCGYDPLPFQWLAHDNNICTNVKFIDVDYEPLLDTKCKIVMSTPKMRDLIHEIPDAATKDKSILLNTEEYSAIGCDLRNLPRLEDLLRSVVDLESCLVLFIAEVSITYMHTDSADALIAWTSTLSTDVTFCLLEQCSPDSPDNPFTATMMRHFAKLGTPLHSVLKYPGVHTQRQRFREAGFSRFEYQNLWELWADAQFLSPSQRMSLDRVEPFDEWEEFALFASHYCLVIARNRVDPFLERPRLIRRDSEASLLSNTSQRTASPIRPDREWFAYKYCKEVGDLCQRHHASAYPIPGQDAVGIYGGIGPKSRLSTSAVCRPRHINATSEIPVVLPPEAGARCCHTVSLMNNGDNILVGGRESPIQPRRDCWLQVGSVWKRIHDLPEPRYRHRTIGVTLPDNVYGAVVFGGKTGPSSVAVDVLLWEPNGGWRVLRTLRGDPIPRFGPNFIKLGYNHGILFGGMRQDGIIIQGLWRWRLKIRNDVVLGISFRPSSALDATVGAYPWFARFGASYSILRDELLIIGGIAKRGCIPKIYEVLSILGSFSAFNEEEREMTLKMTSVEPNRPPDCPRPFFIGHSTHRTKLGMSVIMGGGATCFSFGNYFNSGLWILHEKEAGLSTDWHIVPSQPSGFVEEKAKTAQTPANHCHQEIQKIKVENVEHFSAIVAEHKPRIIENLQFGRCLDVWSSEYLRQKIPPDRSVVTHSSKTRNMNFQRKDFAYQTMSFPEFLDQLRDPTKHLYLRSLAATNPSTTPANLEIDWPEIAPDFEIPEHLKMVKDNLHSSPLRISNDISMWLHYDVMANVLFQIRGVKKLVLFPPTDIEFLSFPPGSTTSELDLFSSTMPGQEDEPQAPSEANPHVVVLHPGDCLFIPPLWSHSGISLKSEIDVQRKSASAFLSKSDSVEANAASSTAETVKPSILNKLLPLSNHHDLDLSPSTQRQVTPQEAQPDLLAPTQTTTSAPENAFTNIAVNVFFRNLAPSKYASGRDVYGNRDLAAYEEGRRDLQKIVKRFTDARKGEEKVRNREGRTHDGEGINSTDKVPGEQSQEDVSIKMPASIPPELISAYLVRLGNELVAKGKALGKNK